MSKSVTPKASSPNSCMVVPVVELLRRPGSHRNLSLKVDFETLTNSDATIEGPVELHILLASHLSGIEVIGTITARWSGVCRRCLAPICEIVSYDLREMFSSSGNPDEIYPLLDAEVDLAPMVRDCLVLALPIAPLCSQACTGPAPDTYPLQQSQTSLDGERDPRWAALDALRISQ